VRDGSVSASLKVTGKLTEESVARLKRYIDAFAAEAAIAWEPVKSGDSAE
jgi:hypothetical protein